MTFKIKINNKDVCLVDSVEFNYQLNRPSSIIFYIDGYKNIEVYDDIEVYENNILLFKGKITKIEPDAYKQITKITAIEIGALKLMSTIINETFPNEDYDQQFRYKIVNENDKKYLYIEVNIPNGKSKTLYVYKMYGYQPEMFDIDLDTPTITANQINEDVLQININNHSGTDYTMIKVDVTDFVNSDSESLFIFDSSSYQRINETFYDYFIEKDNNKYNLWFKVTIPAKYKKRLIIQKGGVKTPTNPEKIFEFYDNFNTLDLDKWDIYTGNWTVSDSNLISDETESLIVSKYLIDKPIKIISKIKTESDLNPNIYLLNYINDSNFDTLIQMNYNYKQISSYQIINSNIKNLKYIETNLNVNEYYNISITKNNTNVISSINTAELKNLFNVNQNGYLAILSNNSKTYVDYIYVIKQPTIDIDIEIKEIDNGIYEITLYNYNDYDLIDYQIKIENLNVISSENDRLIIRNNLNNLFTDIIVYICKKCGLKYEIDEFIKTFKEYNITYENAMNVLNNIATLLGADFYISNGKLYFFKKGGNKNKLILQDNIIENIKIIRSNNNFANKVTVIGESRDGIPLITVATNDESIKKYGIVEKVISDASLKTKEAVILRAIKEVTNLSELKTTGTIRLINKFNINVGDVITVKSINANINRQFRVIKVNYIIKKYNGQLLIDSFKIDIDSQITDVPYVLKDLNDRLKKLENKNVDSKVNKYLYKQIALDINIEQNTYLDDTVAQFDVDKFDFALFN